MSTTRLDTPLSFKVIDEVLHGMIDGRWVPLSKSLNKSAIQLLRSKYDKIDQRYRDLEDTENGSYYFVSPFVKYIGHYKYLGIYQKMQPFMGDKVFLTPQMLRISGPDVSIETITKTQWNNAAKEVDRPTYLNRQDVYSKNSSRFSYVDRWDGELVTVDNIPVTAKNYVNARMTYNILASSLFNFDGEKDYGSGALTEGKMTEVLVLRIDWNNMPDGSYYRYGLAVPKGVSNLTTDRTSLRFLRVDTDKFTPQGDFVLGTQYSSDIERLIPVGEEDASNSNQWKVDGQDKWYETPDHNIYHKVEKGNGRYTYLIAEFSNDNTKYRYNTCIGLLFQMYVKEEDWEYCAKGVNDKDHYYIKDYSNLGKLANTTTLQFREYGVLPSFPEQGDRLHVIEGLNTLQTPKEPVTEPKESTYIYLGPYNDPRRDSFTGGSYHLIHSDRFPSPNMSNEVGLNYLLGDDGKVDAYLTFYKKIK